MPNMTGGSLYVLRGSESPELCAGEAGTLLEVGNVGCPKTEQVGNSGGLM